MKYLRIFLFLVFASGLSSANDDMVKEVYRIFKSKCDDCHGSHIEKPKGKFGYVLDLARVGKNTKWVTPKEPGDSDLYDLLETNEMPGKDSGIPALTPAELKAVSDWIEAGCPGISKEAIASLGDIPSAKPKPPFLDRFLKWIGKFHPASTHFPVGLLLAAVLAEGIAWFTKRPDWLLVTRFLVVVSALSAPGVAFIGWMNAKYGGFQSTLTEWHRWLGVGTAAWAIVCAVLICSSECAEGSSARMRFRWALILGAILVSVTGFLGGLLTFGVDHYKW
jgi:uncharacterized membrane protein